MTAKRPWKYSEPHITNLYVKEGFSPEEAAEKAKVFCREIHALDMKQYRHDREFYEHETPRPELFPPHDD